MAAIDTPTTTNIEQQDANWNSKTVKMNYYSTSDEDLIALMKSVNIFYLFSLLNMVHFQVGTTPPFGSNKFDSGYTIKGYLILTK